MQSIISMRVERTLISNVILFYYSRKGNTKAIVNLFENICTIDEIENIRKYQLHQYEYIIFATSTYGRGIPPDEFFKVRDALLSIEDKKIGLFGSGNSHYEYFCGALDLIEQLLSLKNEITFKYKFEGYPKKIDFDNMRGIINDKIN